MPTSIGNSKSFLLRYTWTFLKCFMRDGGSHFDSRTPSKFFITWAHTEKPGTTWTNYIRECGITSCHTRFFNKQCIFSTQRQCCLTFYELSIHEFCFKCCLLQIDMVLPRHAIFRMFIPFLRLGLLIIWSICHYIIFIFITINHNLIKIATLVYLDIFLKSSSGCCLAFAQFFCQFQPGVTYNSVAYKTSVYFSKIGLVIKSLITLCVTILLYKPISKQSLQTFQRMCTATGFRYLRLNCWDITQVIQI